jgi:hypothetical protein
MEQRDLDMRSFLLTKIARGLWWASDQIMKYVDAIDEVGHEINRRS